MSRVNADVIIAVFLLLVCGAFFAASYEIRDIDYGILTPAAWPRAILVALTVLCCIYLAQSLLARKPDSPAESAEPFSFKRLIGKYRNPLWCYAMFLLFLLTLDYLGMLIGSVMFVFCLLSVIGEFTKRAVIVHALVSIIMVGAMWALFTYGLGVLFPQGEIISFQ